MALSEYAPAAHSGVESQMPRIDFLGNLPRKRASASRALLEAWSGVGLPDPETWGPMVTPQKVLLVAAYPE